MNDQQPRVRRDHSAAIVGFFLLFVAGVLFYDTYSVDRAVAYGVGPTAMPKVISGGLAILGVLSLLSAVKGERFEIESTDWRAVAIVVAGFLTLTVMIGSGAGFIPAMTVLFTVTSYAFGRRALMADAAIGVVLATLIYLLFSKLLALSLPQGPIERLFG
ncbi:MAG TPA: tripartite tricarboxylate transporter TctB family protein [Beijerinckiaceae bacterium]|nr:tripartite tricarboxylate transporter TctB family protein [Beijerinckiaceae bacterium]